MIPTLTTERLILRPIMTTDALDMYEYAKKPYIGPNAGWHPHLSVDETRLIIQMFQDSSRKTGLGVFAILLKTNMKMIGTIEIYNRMHGFKAELGYCLNDEYWGHGYIVEASKMVLKWGFENLKLSRIEVSLFTDNHQSERVCQKLQMEYEGIKKKAYLRYDGKILDCKIYAMTDDLYYKLKEGSYE